MVDTIRTMSALQSLLADNTAGDISPQDVRDFLVSSLTGGYGMIYVTGGTASQSSITTTDTLVTGFASNGGTASGVTETAASDKLTLDRAGKWKLDAHVTGDGDETVVYTFTLRYNGSLTNYAARQTVATAGTLSLSVSGIVTSTGANEDVELYVKTDGSGAFVARECQLIATRIGD